MGLSRLTLTSCVLLLLAFASNQPTVSIAPERVSRPQPKEIGTPTEARTRPETKAEDRTEPAQKFALPLFWNGSKNEPLALARAYLKESFQDNQQYMEHGTRFFSAFSREESPRATVVTCADSRVQTQAWDKTSENDDYTIRNFGNQVARDEASVEYGVEQLQTPLLLIIGHTGCSALKAASGDTSKLSKSLRAELEAIHVPRPTAGRSSNQIWADAVVANVHGQVQVALLKFGKRVQSGALTVVGAVYDFRDDLGQGAGKLVIVDVNGNTEGKELARVMGGLDRRTAASQDKRETSAKSLAQALVDDAR